jgi:transcriptional regulator GlxA family with amidase domain
VKTQPVDVLFLVLPDTLLLDLAGPAEALRLANQQLARRSMPPMFRLRYVGPERNASTSVGLTLSGLEPLPDRLPPRSWVVLLGRPGEATQVVRRQPAWLAARDWLGRVVAPSIEAPDTVHRLLTVCVGSLLAADAGLLARRTVTGHHELLDELRALAPAARVIGNRVFVEDGPVASSAGITAGIDLALHLVSQELGDALASAVAQVMVVYHRRSGDDPERSPLLAGRNHLHPAVHAVQSAVLEAPGEDWSLERMAALAHVTPRHLARLFREHAGVTPREHVEQVRLALAQQARAAGLRTPQALALAGFNSDRQWRRARQRAGN